MYAVVETGGKQYRVELGSELEIDRLDAQPGTSIELGRVLLVADGDEAQIGMPVVDGARVTADVLRQDRGDKITVFKYRPKARRRVKQGHRAEMTVVRVSDIVLNGRSAAESAQAADKQAAAERAAAEKEAARKAAADQALAEKLAADQAVQETPPAEKPSARKAAAKASTTKPSAKAAGSKAPGAKPAAKPAPKAAGSSASKPAAAKAGSKPAAGQTTSAPKRASRASGSRSTKKDE